MAKKKSLEKKILFYKNQITEVEDQNKELKQKLEKKLRSDIIFNLDISDENLKEAFKNFLNKKFGLLKEQIFEMSFLIKYCSTSAYRRLWILSHDLLPPPSSVDSHFKNKVKIVKKQLIDPAEINPLLDAYWAEQCSKIGIKDNSDNSFKIELVIGVDAASLTSFNQSKNDRKKCVKVLLDDEVKKKNSEMKSSIIDNLINGKKSIFIKQNGAILPNGELLKDKDAKHFFAFLLQPLDWRLPIIAIYLAKSPNGHFSINEYQDIISIVSVINEHPHFHAQFIAADGKLALNKLHLKVYEKYKKEI